MASGKELKVVISGQDDLSPKLKALAKAADDFADSLQKGGDKSGKSFEEVSRGAETAEKSIAQLSETGSGFIRVMDGFSGSISTIGAGLQSLGFALDGLGQSSLEQQRQIMALDQLYGEASQRYQDFARTIQETTIFSDDQARQAEIYFATLRNNYGVTEEQIQRLVQVSADLATIHGVSLEDAAMRIQSAIRGEAEAAEYLGLTLNQQSIDRENLTLTMSNQEAAAFRLNALWEQTANVTGASTAYVQTANGQWQQFKNTMQDTGQTVGSVVGPIGNVVGTLGKGLATVGEATRGITDIKNGMTGLVGVARNSALAMSAFSLATGPVGLAVLGVTAAVGAGLYVWQQQQKETKAAQKAWEDYGRAVMTVEDTIANERLHGSDALATRMEATQKAINDSVAIGVSSAQEKIEQNKLDWNKVLDAKGAEATIAEVTAFISDGMGKAALDWARETGRLTDEAVNNIIANPAANLGQLQTIMNEYWAALTPTDADATRVQEKISKVFELMSNPKIDQAKLTEGVQKIYTELAKTGDVDAALASFDALFTELEAGASSFNNLSAAAKLASQYIGEFEASIVRANTQLADNGRLASATGDAIAELMRAQTGEYPAEDATRRYNNLLEEQARLEHELGEAIETGNRQAIDEKTNALAAVNTEIEKQNAELARNLALRAELANAGLIDAGFASVDDANAGRAEERAARWAEIGTAAGRQVAASMDDAATSAQQATNAFAMGAQALDATASAAEKAAAKVEAINQAQKDVISGWMQLTGNDNVVSQLNIAGLGTSYTRLAEGVNDANTVMSDGFRIVVGNTNAIAQTAQTTTDWATELINVQGEYGKIDDLLAAGTITQSQYNDAQQAYNTIAADNASIQEDILTIQAKQAPVLAELMSGTQDYVETLSTLPPMQQAVALGWMDANEAAKANQILTMAAAAANGELGAKGEAATTAMIQGAVAADPYLKAMLLDMGLISEGADGTITVHFDGAESTKASLDDLNNSILTLADLLDNGQLDGSIDIAVQGREEIQAALEELDALTAHNDEVINVKIVTGEALTDSDRRSSGIDGPFDAGAGRDVVIKITADNSDAIQKTGEAQAAADKLGATNAVVSLSAANGASSVILAAQSLADNFGETDVSALLGAEDNASSTIQGVIDLMGSFESKTVTLSVVTAYSTTGSPTNYSGGSGLGERHGGIPAYATGGVVFHGGEAGMELAHFAGGGIAPMPWHGLYEVPAGTRIEPHNSVITKLSPGGRLGGPLVNIENITIGAGADPSSAQAIVSEIITRLDRALEHRDRAGGLVS
ncbi:MAG: hypothetical protein WBA46_05795 [Thermomicrobiales bacterium]